MHKKLFVAILAVAALLISSVPALAITYGEPDNERHPNVGAMIVETPNGFFSVCSGTLIDDDVFLTASHCTAFVESLGFPVFVTFDEEFDQGSTLIPGTMHTNPLFPGNSSDSQDIAVIVLDYPASVDYPEIEPAQLPTAGFLDIRAKKNGLKGQVFTNVGYGVHEREIGGGPIQFPGGDTRMLSYSTFNALNKTWLRLSQNPATGDAGTCFGDSGGPQFFGGDTSNLIVSITITGDSTCRATNVTYRLDTPSARNFLDDFVTLP